MAWSGKTISKSDMENCTNAEKAWKKSDKNIFNEKSLKQKSAYAKPSKTKLTRTTKEEDIPPYMRDK